MREVTMVTDIEGEGGYEIKSEVGVCAMAVQPCSRSRIRRDLAVTDPMSASTGPVSYTHLTLPTMAVV